MKYFAIDNGSGYHSRFICENCADTEKLTGMDIIERVDPIIDDIDPTNPTGTWCDFCNAALDTTDEETTRKVTSLEMLGTYNAAPIAKFQPATLEDLNKIAGEVNDPATELTATTEWSRSALDADRESIASALALYERGHAIFVARDDDGWYFATSDASAANATTAR